jgi:glutathione synthase/RimK-type ligase-like ATP-grasp enzyme
MAKHTPTERVVILARTHDPTLKFVTKYLSEEPVVIDIGRMVKDGMSYRFSTEAWPEITLAGQFVDLSPKTVKSVWYRNTTYKHMGPKLPLPPEFAFAEESSVGSLTRMGHSIAEFFPPDVLWVSKPDAVRKAELKPRQLAQARRSGFNVPETLYTTDPRQALQFVRERDICIIKPLAPYPPEGYGQPTHLVRYSNNLDLTGVSVQAHIFQQLIEPAYELRVAVVDNQTFAAKVWDNNQAEALAEGIRDWRRGVETDTLGTSAFALPRQVANACIKYTKLMGLLGGFFDLIVDKKGKYWFLECNPNGQWAFVDEHTVERISKALARLLESPLQRKGGI